MITVNIEITASKLFAFLAFAIVAAYAFIQKDHIPMTTALPSLSVLLGAKMYKDIKTSK